MKLQFDANQEYRLYAIKAAVDLFTGQPVGVSDFAFDKAARVGGQARREDFMAEKWKRDKKNSGKYFIRTTHANAK